MKTLSAIFMALAVSTSAYATDVKANTPTTTSRQIQPETAADLCVMREVNELSIQKAAEGIAQLTMDIRDIKRDCETSTQSSAVVTEDWNVLDLTLTPAPRAPVPAHNG